MSQRMIVLANGNIENPAVERARLAAWDGVHVVAADGGAKYAGALGLSVGVVVGDMDSLDPALRTALEAQGTQIRPSPADKDETDLELALLYAADQGAEHIAVLGALGGRLDMALANVLVLAHPRLTSLRVELWAGRQTAWLIRSPGGELPGKVGDTLSLIPLNGDAQGVTTTGLAYALRGETLAFGPARGVSNVIDAPQARVDLREGLLLAVHTPDRA